MRFPVRTPNFTRPLAPRNPVSRPCKAKSSSIDCHSHRAAAPPFPRPRIPSSIQTSTRAMSTASSGSTVAPDFVPRPESLDVAFSSNADPAALAEVLALLLRSGGGRWQLTAQRNGLERTFKFKTFKKTWGFMNAVATECEVKKHHPEWSNVYNTTFIRWTTHSPPGLSAKDVSMATFCDQQAAAFAEVVPAPDPTAAVSDVADSTAESSSLGKDLADRVVSAGVDCCVPKSKRG